MTMLPISKSEINVKLSDQVILVYGRPKIGKSTFCSYFDEALFIATEPGLNHLEVFKVPVNSWEKFLEVCREISLGEHKFKTIIIDTVDNLVTFCNEYIAKQQGVPHISEIDHNMGWHLATVELMRVLVKLSGFGIGLVLVSHAVQSEVKTKTKTYNRFTIDIGGKNQRKILALMDLILFMDSDVQDGVEKGIMRCKPSQYWEAGDKSKRLPEEIMFPLDNPKVAYDQIVTAFGIKK